MRQYIGARYVPKFMGTYDPTQIYEALCVVDNGMGTSYISKVPTPANTPLTDTDYWAIYGASSGAIINLQNQIDTIVNTTIPNVDNKIGTLSNLKTIDKSNIVSAINEIVAPTRKYIFIGDSYNYQPSFSFDVWGGLLATKLGLSASDYVDLATSGGGFAVAGNNGTFKSLLETVTSDRDTYTDIVVQGGSNDYNTGLTESQVDTAIETFVTYAKTNFPNAKVHIAMIGWTTDNTGFDRFHRSLVSYKKAVNYGAFYIDNSEFIIHDYGHFYDAGHPDGTGQDRIAQYLFEYLTVGHFDVDYIKTVSFSEVTSNGSIDGALTGRVIHHLHNDRVEVTFGSTSQNNIPCSLKFNMTATSWSATGEKNMLKDMNDGLALPTYSYYSKCLTLSKIAGMAIDSNNVMYPLVLTPVGKVLRVTSSGVALSNINTIVLYPDTFTYPTLYC